MSDWSPEDEKPPQHPLLALLRPPTPEQLAELEQQRDRWASEGELIRLTLPRYSGPDVPCRKCGAIGAAALHHDCREHEVCLKTFGRHEGLWRECRTCRYRWAERCLDDDGTGP